MRPASRDAIELRGAVCEEFLLEDLAPRPLTRAPKAVLDSLEHADAGILCMHPLQGELGARKDIVGVVERRRIRYAHMVGVTPEIMQQGMRADYTLVDRLSEKLARSHAQGALAHRPDGRRHIARCDFRCRARLGKNQRPDQPPLLVESSGG